MQEHRLFTFGDYVLDAADERLWRQGHAIHLTPKAFALLALLVMRPGQLVTKEELFRMLWSGRFVTDAALARCVRELRGALGDSARAPRYVETVHGRGLRFIASVATSRGERQPASGATAGFFGRDRELESLWSAWERARDGARQVLFITGEAGIGKTTLVEAFVAKIRAVDEAWVAQGRCIDHYGKAEPYLPLLEALERLGHRVGEERFAAVLRRFAPSWIAELPFAPQDSAAPHADPPHDDASPQRMLRELTYCLEEVARERPVVLWLEDLHWSDNATLDFMSFFAGRREPARLVLVGTYRPADVLDRGHPLQELVGHLTLRGESRQLTLDKLDQAAIAAYLAMRFASRRGLDTAALARAIASRFEGIPLFMVAVADQIDQACAAGEPLEEGLLRMPPSLWQLIERQIERLADDEQRLLETASVVGAEFMAEAIAAGLAMDVGLVEARCASLARRGRFLRAAGEGEWPDGSVSAQFAFVHALYRELLIERIPGHRLARLQQLIGEREERAYGARAGAIAGQLAMRFEAARDRVRALHYHELAGKNALSRHAYAEARQQLESALMLLEPLEPQARMRRELDLLLPLGAALMASNGYAAAATGATYERALTLCRQVGSPGELTRVLKGLWNVSLVRGETAAAKRLASELLERAEAASDDKLARDAWARLGQSAFHCGEIGAARDSLMRALQRAEARDTEAQRHSVPRILAYLAWIDWYLGFPERAVAHGREALASAHQHGNVHSLAFALGFVGWLHWFRRENALAAQLADEQLSLCVEHGLTYWLTWGTFLRELALFRQGRDDSGLKRMRDALGAHRATGAAVGVASFLADLADAFGEAGRAAEGLQLIGEAEALLRRTGNRYHEAEIQRLRGELLLRVGGEHVGEARQCFVRALEVARLMQARTLELRAATSLCASARSDAQARSARRELESVYRWFSEGFETADLRRAGALLGCPCG